MHIAKTNTNFQPVTIQLDTQEELDNFINLLVEVKHNTIVSEVIFLSDFILTHLEEL